MGNIVQKLEYLKDTKEAIKTAIVDKGGSIADDASFRSYAEIITNLPSGGGDDVEPLVLTGNCNGACKGVVAEYYIKNYGDKITSIDINDSQEMFNSYTLETIPFELNYKENNTSNNNLESMYKNADRITVLPKMNYVRPGNTRYLFYGCTRIREIPKEYFDNWDFSYWSGQTTTYYAQCDNMFGSCYSLRKIPVEIFEHANPVARYSNTAYYYMANGCATLDEIVDIPIPYTAESDGDYFYAFCYYTFRVKNITFKMPDGKPYIKKWKGQTIDISQNTGWAQSLNTNRIIGYNSGITREKQVITNEHYQALKNDPDWYTEWVEYSRYNKISAVNTINSLPDTSAYLLEKGGTNTIKFKGSAGSATDGGAINTMTAEEIAVATAKGWTVSLV